MIDKNDVKMPVQREDSGIDTNNKEQIAKIQDLLELVNTVENKQSLRLGDDYYGKYEWFGQSNSKSYFSYQEEAVYHFIFNLNKSGILSDQVGMGKTIEAGMIISELASRSELSSLLIVVPNEIMSKKWKQELEDKFGIRYYVSPEESGGAVFPSVTVIRNYDDFCLSAFDCLKKDKFAAVLNFKFDHTGYKEKSGDTPYTALKSCIREDIDAVIDLINEALDNEERDERVEFDGKKFYITGTSLQRDYVFDESGEIEKYLNRRQRQTIRQMLEARLLYERHYPDFMRHELNGLYTMLGDYFVTNVKHIDEGDDDSPVSLDDIYTIARRMTETHPILVVPISYADEKGESRPFLNQTLLSEVKNYKHMFYSQDSEGKLEEQYEEYRVVDFFIDAGYQTMIVDEVHDYINVCAKVGRSLFHAQKGCVRYPSDQYTRYELYDDYYFIKKSSLYKKLKQLADKANRKIFLTATPIKSDMVDFYLLALLASNKDSEAYKKLEIGLNNDYPVVSMSEKEKNRRRRANLKKGLDENEGIPATTREEAINELYSAVDSCIEQAAENFCNFPDRFLAFEKTDDGSGTEKKGRYKYPYFRNSFLLKARRSEEVVDYMRSYIGYMTAEELVMELILAYQAELKESGKTKTEGTGNVKESIENLNKLLDSSRGEELELQTRVIFRALFNNPVRSRFEEDFVKEDGSPILRIRELLEMEDGPRRWNKTYQKYGIRHTRHQTYNLADCPLLGKLNKTKVERYQNLPLWPRRDGKVIFLVRADVFFDKYLQVGRSLPEKRKGNKLKPENLPNYDQLSVDESVKQEMFDNAVAIFDYINDSMSGGDPENHLPQSNYYESLDMDDSAIAEYKLALINRLMQGDGELGNMSNRVLLFAEKGRDKILDWFRYQKCAPLYKESEPLDPKRVEKYEEMWRQYRISPVGGSWTVSTDASALSSKEVCDNLLIIIDPKRYEKGVDLQKADTIINFDINYDPLKMEQRIGRIDRIRPKGAEQNINIISFVPLVDMSGFVINFFANEMKMFTQWMGETTGIVSVPEDESTGGKVGELGEAVSFEDRVLVLEKFYKYIYDICNKPNIEEYYKNAFDYCKKKDDKGEYKYIYDLFKNNSIAANETVTKEKLAGAMAAEFHRCFDESKKQGDGKGAVCAEDDAKIDLLFLMKLRDAFDCAFRNSASPRGGIRVETDERARLMRFNTSFTALFPCGAKKCDSCPKRNNCRNGASYNTYSDFDRSVRDFFEFGKRFYADTYNQLQRGDIKLSGGSNTELSRRIKDREELFGIYAKDVLPRLPGFGSEPAVMPFNKYEDIFEPIKELYWDSVVQKYIDYIMQKFYKQCDTVIEGAEVFEDFIKTFSVADFMINMVDRTNA